MPDIIIVAQASEQARIEAVARRLATVLRCDTRVLSPPPANDADEIARMLAELDRADAVLAVIPGETRLTAPCWQLIRAANKPVLVVPPSVLDVERPIRRALVPLNGTAESAAAIAESTALLAAAGVELIVLHVFVAETVPKYWDQSAYAQTVWEDEFRARFCAAPAVQIRIRSGVPSENVNTVAEQENVDLVALGWSQNLDAGHGRIVHRAATLGTVPVLLVPISIDS